LGTKDALWRDEAREISFVCRRVRALYHRRSEARKNFLVASVRTAYLTAQLETRGVPS
jgi:hypothetical protein